MEIQGRRLKRLAGGAYTNRRFARRRELPNGALFAGNNLVFHNGGWLAMRAPVSRTFMGRINGPPRVRRARDTDFYSPQYPEGPISLIRE